MWDFLIKCKSLSKSFGFLLLSFVVGTAQVFALSYLVKKDDTLSTIAQKKIAHKPYTVFAKGGPLEKLVGLNPQVENPDLLTPGQLITLPGAQEHELAAEGPRDLQMARKPAAENQALSTAQSFLPQVAVANADVGTGGYGIVSLTPGFSFFRINAVDPSTGGRAQILSNVNTDLNVSWKQVFSSTTQTHLDFNYSRLSLSDPTSRTISSSGDNVFGFDVGVTHAVNSRFSIFSSLGYQQELLLRALTSEKLTLDRLFVPFLSVGAGYDFFMAKPFTFSVDGQAAYHAPTEGSAYKFRGGPSYTLRLKINQNVKLLHGTLEGAVYGKHQNQNTSAAKQSRTDMGATVGATWKFE